MMARRSALGALGGVFSLGVSACNPFLAKASYRYRMTVEGKFGGAAVYEVLAQRTRAILLPDERPGGSALKGEALVLETPTGPVFVLLKSQGGSAGLIGSVTHALTPDIPMGGQPNFWKAVNRLGDCFASARGELPPEDWPLMVRFRDLGDPKSVEQVNPRAIGVKRIVVETTSDDVTRGIQARLIWLDALEKSQSDNIFETSSSTLVGQLRN